MFRNPQTMQSDSLPSVSSYTSSNSNSSPTIRNQTPKSAASSDALSSVQTVSESPMPKTAGLSSIKSLNTPSINAPLVSASINPSGQSDQPALTKAFAAKVVNAPVLRAHMGDYTLEGRPLSETYSPEADGLAWEASTPGLSAHFMLEGDAAPYTAILTEFDHAYPVPDGFVALNQRTFEVDQIDGEITARLTKQNLGINKLAGMALLDGSHAYYEADPNDPQTPKLVRFIELRREESAEGGSCTEIKTFVDQPENERCPQKVIHWIDWGELTTNSRGEEKDFCLKEGEVPRRFCKMKGNYSDLKATPASRLTVSQRAARRNQSERSASQFGSNSQAGSTSQTGSNLQVENYLASPATVVATLGAAALVAKYLIGGARRGQANRGRIIRNQIQNRNHAVEQQRSQVVRERRVAQPSAQQASAQQPSPNQNRVDAAQANPVTVKYQTPANLPSEKPIELDRLSDTTFGKHFDTPKQLALGGETLPISEISFEDHALLRRSNVRSAIKQAIQSDELTSISHLSKQVKGQLAELGDQLSKYQFTAPLGRSNTQLICGHVVEGVMNEHGVPQNTLTFKVVGLS